MTLTLEQIAAFENRLRRADKAAERKEWETAISGVTWVLMDMLANEKMRLENEAIREAEPATPPGHVAAVETLPREVGGGVGG